MPGSGTGTPAGGGVVDYTTNLGKVRLLITDTEPANYIFTNDQINAFLSINSDSVLLAAAQALMVIAANEALVLKVIRLLDLQTDGASVGRELRMQAKVLQEQAAAADYDFDWAEMNLNTFTWREIIWNDALRST